MAGIEREKESDGFNHTIGVFRRICRHCGKKTRERVSHRISRLSIYGDIVGWWYDPEPMHFRCHFMLCFHEHCQKHGRQWLEKMGQENISQDTAGDP
ncbi:MAG: hypothetical protein HYT37_03595 [Candidatus Sungbacteria bacterium]|nr:hypothetical protein [Candidatus Sungbacteria bacterium]